MKKQTIAILILIFFGFLFATTSCKKTTNGASTGTFYMHLHTNIDTNEVDDTTALYRDATGRHFGLSVAQFYISNIMVHNVNGSMYTIAGAYILKSIDSEQYLVGTAPVGTYDYVMFDVGLPSAINALQPTGFTTTGYTANSTMWYGNTTQGFMFMKLQGFADTTAAQSGTSLVNFSYQIGSASNLKTLTMPTRGTGNYTTYKPYILLANTTQYIHLIADYGALLSVINFKTQDSTDSYNLNPTIANTIANNIPNMFHYEE